MKSRRVSQSWVIAAVLGLNVCGAEAADWPNWRGPNHDGVSLETGWSTDWPADGPEVLWEAAIGTGFSSIAVANGRVYTMGNINNTDIVWCLDAATGDEIWKHRYAAPLDDKNYEGGPNATPTVDGDRVYTLSKRGMVFCLDAGTGAVVWSKDLHKDFGIKWPDWGLSGSALVLEDMVVFNAGTSGIAFDKATGALVWQSGKKPSGYATPMAFRQAGRKRLAIFASKSLVAVDAKTGEEAWSYPWKTSWNVNAATPIVSGETMFISSGYGKGCALLGIDGEGVREIHVNRSMRNQCNNSVLWRGYVYGNDGQVGSKGRLT